MISSMYGRCKLSACARSENAKYVRTKSPTFPLLEGIFFLRDSYDSSKRIFSIKTNGSPCVQITIVFPAFSLMIFSRLSRMRASACGRVSSPATASSHLRSEHLNSVSCQLGFCNSWKFSTFEISRFLAFESGEIVSKQRLNGLE